jgi:putative ABC transport system permease protein
MRLEDFELDFRFAIRALLRAPCVTTAAIATLALGIGLSVAIFSVVQSVVLHQLPFRDPDRLVSVASQSSDPRGRVNMWLANEWRLRSRSFQSIAAFDDSQLLATTGGETQVLRGMRVSAEFFATLGVTPVLGRDFFADDERSPDAVILTHDTWVRRFNADPAIVGRTIDADPRVVRVIGVLPESFHGLRMSNPAEIPQYFAPLPSDVRTCQRCTERLIARLVPAMAPAGAAAELAAITRDVVRINSDIRTEPSVIVVPLLDRLLGSVRRVLLLLLAAVVSVLLTGCTNVAGLQLVRATARRREFALRAALGAVRQRLAWQLLIENLLIALVGGAAGIALGGLATGALASWAPAEMPRVDEIRMDGGVLLAAVAATIATGLLCGLAPILTASRPNAIEVLTRTSDNAGTGGHRLRNALVMADVALAFVLIMTTGLLVRSFDNLRSVDAGFDPHCVLTLTPVASPSGAYSSPAGRMDYYRLLMARVRELPGIIATGMVSNVPLSNIEPVRVRTERESVMPPTFDDQVDRFVVGGDYFQVLGIPLLAGRWLGGQDDTPPGRSLLVSQSFATTRLGGLNPIGQAVHFEPNGAWSTIVGVVGDVRHHRLERRSGPAIYIPQSAFPTHYTRLVVRTSGDPRQFERAIVAAVREVDSSQGVFHIQPMEDYVSAALADRRFAVTLIALFGLLSLVLSAIGLYGAVAFSVAQRTAEIGIRCALGADHRDILMMILKQGALLTSMGLAIGLGASVLVSRFLTVWLFEVAQLDPLTLGTTAVVLLAVSFCASLIPAISAVRIAPSRALRAD